MLVQFEAALLPTPVVGHGLEALQLGTPLRHLGRNLVGLEQGSGLGDGLGLGLGGGLSRRLGSGRGFAGARRSLIRAGCQAVLA